MRRKVKFQGLFAEEAEDESSIGLNSLRDRSVNSRLSKGGKGHNGSVFTNDQNDEDESVQWTLSSLGPNRHLYGRSKERNLLRQAYRRLWESEAGSKPTVQLVLISGSAGAGKTALAMSIGPLVTEDGGFFVQGKFDQMQGSEMYSAFVTAFNELVETVIKRGADAVRSMRKAIQSAVHSEQRMLLDMIPALEKILGPQKKDYVKEFRQSSDEVSCFKFVFRMFMRAISSPEFPIVFLLDDLQFADEASLELLQALVTDVSNDGVLFIGTYRSENVSDHKMREYLKNKSSIPITEIPLANLSPRAVDEMVAEIFSVVEPEQIKPLTGIIYRQTAGNVFYIREFLRYLQEEGLLNFDETGMEWVWDERKIQMKIDFRRPVELMTVRISKLPKATREVLEVAACLGSGLDEKLLNRISPRPVFAQLQKATSRGFLHYDEVDETYRFAHDVIQEAAYKMISYQEREAFHLTIGRELWKSFDDIEDLERHIFIILGQIRSGADLITYQEERNDVAALCLRAGELAICSSSFQTASEYLLLGVSMLGETCWEEEYELSLELYNAAAEVEYCIANFDNVEKLASEIFAHTRWFPDTLRAHSIHVYSLGSRGHMLKAIERGLEVLEALGEKFPSKNSSHSIAVAMKRTKWLIKGKSNETLLRRLPLMDDPEKIAAMQMMNIIFLYAYIAIPTLAPMIACRMVKLTIEYGLCDVSCVGFVTFSMLLCG
jgi:histidine kinase